MRFTINLATRTYLDHRVINRLAYGVIAVLVLFTVWNVVRVSSNLGELGRLNTDISAIQGKLGVRPNGTSEADFIRQKARIRFYNEIIERKSTNWLNLLELFENVTPEGIALSSLLPDKKPGEWKLEGRARSFKVIQQYLEKLESSKNVSNVLLLSHQNIAIGEKGRGVQFAISCRVLN
jgi:hypothetical protein